MSFKYVDGIQSDRHFCNCLCAGFEEVVINKLEKISHDFNSFKTCVLNALTGLAADTSKSDNQEPSVVFQLIPIQNEEDLKTLEDELQKNAGSFQTLVGAVLSVYF